MPLHVALERPQMDVIHSMTLVEKSRSKHVSLTKTPIKLKKKKYNTFSVLCICRFSTETKRFMSWPNFDLILVQEINL